MLGIVWVPGYFAVIPLTADVIALRDYEAEGDPDLHSTDIEWYDEVGWHVLVNVPETGIPTYSWRHDPSGREQCGELAPPPPAEETPHA